MRKILVLGILVFLVMGAWAAGWFWAAGQVRQQVANLAENDAETAPRLTCGTLSVGGFPFRFDVACEDAKLESGDETITVKGVRASVLAYNPTHVLFFARAPYSMTNAFTGSSSRIDFDTLEGSVRVVTDDLMKGLGGTGWRVGRISLVVDGFAWNDTVISDVLQAEAGHLELQVADLPTGRDKAAGTAGLALALMARGLTAPGLTIAKADAQLTATLTGLPDDLLVLANDPDPVRNWQRRGGVFTLTDFSGAQPDPAQDFKFSGEASLTDAGLLNAKLAYSGLGVADRLSRIIPPTELAMLKGKQDAEGHFENAFGIVDGKLKLLTMTLLELPPLW